MFLIFREGDHKQIVPPRGPDAAAEATQAITFSLPASRQLNGSVPALTASSTSGLTAFTFTSSTTSVCTVSGAAVTLVATGTCHREHHGGWRLPCGGEVKTYAENAERTLKGLYS